MCIGWSLPAYTSGEQLSGFSSRNPFFSCSSSSELDIVGYGKPPSIVIQGCCI